MRDGRPDLAVTALAGETFPLYRNEGGGAFRDAGVSSGLGALTVRRSGWGIAFGDFDNDGAVDLFTANAHVNDRIDQFEASLYLEPNRVYRNAGKGRFVDVSATVGEAFQQPAAHRGAVTADLDGDGRLDVVTTALGGPAEIWKNTSPSTGHWLEVRLRGTAASRDGMGARVRIGTQTAWITTSASYASSKPPMAHFGLLAPRHRQKSKSPGRTARLRRWSRKESTPGDDCDSAGRVGQTRSAELKFRPHVRGIALASRLVGPTSVRASS